MEPRIIDYSSAFLKLCISGKRYKVLKSTALALHGSLFAELANLDGRSGIDPRSDRALNLTPEAARSFYLIDTNEFYFERSSTVFDYVLHYVYTGRLHCPSGVCKEMLLDELVFWRVLSEDDRQDQKVALCCVVGPNDEKTGSSEANGRTAEDELDEVEKKPIPFWRKVWLCCEDPSSSVAASLLNIISIFFILLSIVNLVLSTVKALHHCKEPTDVSTSNSTSSQNVTEASVQGRQYRRCEGGPIFDTIEAVCIGWFTLELLVRFIACPNKCRFFKSTMNIIDLLATVPFYIELLLWALNVNTGKLLVIYVFRLLRILRIMRALRLARYFDSIRIMGETFKKCRRDLAVLIVFISMAMVISASIIYYFERDEEDTPYTSIPVAFWWSIVTLTTVGYGDVTPSTSGGRVCAAIVCVVGIILMAMPISIMVEQFTQTYKSRNVKRKRADVKQLLKSVSKRSSDGRTKPDKDDTKYEEDAKLTVVPKSRQIS